MDFREILIPLSSLDDVATKGAQSLNRKLKIAARVRLRYVFHRLKHLTRWHLVHTGPFDDILGTLIGSRRLNFVQLRCFRVNGTPKRTIFTNWSKICPVPYV